MQTCLIASYRSPGVRLRPRRAAALLVVVQFPIRPKEPTPRRGSPPSGRRGLQRSPPRRPGMGVQEVLDLNRVDVLPPDTTTSFNRSTRYKRHTGRRGTSSRPCGSHHPAAQCGLIGVVPVPRLHVRAPVHLSFARSRGRAVPAVIAFAAACADTSSAPCPSLARPQLSAINADPPFWSSLSPGPGWWESLCGRRLTRCSSR